ncbi:MAG: FadR family transcriptional regulator [Spirochaetaceae bacterium]|nr:MAG: FadR family transcriptional regulator [Spirochaetaceae bacterium]
MHRMITSMRDGVSRQSVVSQVAEALMDQIHDGVLTPGARLPSEHALSESFGVSRPMVREAIRDLSAKGYVRVVNGRGAVVREMNDEPLRIFFRRVLGPDYLAWRDLMAVRRVLEGHAAAEAAGAASDSDIEVLKSIIERMGARTQTPDLYAIVDFEFHVEIARISGNLLIHYLIKSVRDSVRSIMERALMLTDKQKFEEIHQLHVDIFDGIARRDPERARAAMDRHFADVQARVQKQLGEVQP